MKGNILWKTTQVTVVGYNNCAMTRLYVSATEAVRLMGAIRQLGFDRVSMKTNRRETDPRSQDEMDRAGRLIREARKVLAS